MIILSKVEKEALDDHGIQARKREIYRKFLADPHVKASHKDDLKTAFDEDVEVAFSLDRITDREALNLCLIAFSQATKVVSTLEYQTCKARWPWSGRGLYLTARKEMRDEERHLFL